MTEMTQAELLAEATERFGPDPMKWAFVCPMCSDVATGADFKAALETAGDDRDASEVLGTHCIGRFLGALRAHFYEGRGCDWCAFGLISGPVAVTLPSGKVMHAFELAEAG